MEQLNQKLIVFFSFSGFVHFKWFFKFFVKMNLILEEVPQYLSEQAEFQVNMNAFTINYINYSVSISLQLYQ